jgi:hypothetical protein
MDILAIRGVVLGGVGCTDEGARVRIPGGVLPTYTLDLVFV